MNTYYSSGMRDVKAEHMGEAASVFAQRLARRRFGRRGDVRILNETAHSVDGTFCEYQSFIGITKGNETTGHNVNFTVKMCK